MVDIKLVEKITQLVFLMLVVSWGLNCVSQLKLCGLSEPYVIPKELTYILLALITAGGSSKSVQAIVNRVKKRNEKKV